MNEIKIWAQDISIILIVTGILIKTVSEKSERHIMRVITTLVIVTAILRLNISAVSDSCNRTAKPEINYSYDEMSSRLYNELSNMSEKSLRDYIIEIIKTYDKNSLSEIIINENNIEIKIKSESMTGEDYESIKNRLKSEINCNITVIRQGD